MSTKQAEIDDSTKNEISQLKKESSKLPKETNQIHKDTNISNSIRFDSNCNTQPAEILIGSKHDFKTKCKKVKTKYNNKIKIIANCLIIKNILVRLFLAELLGTFIFLSLSLGSIAQFVFGRNINYLSVAVSFGFSLSLAIVVAGKVSGGHFNPAVSFAFLIIGKLSALRFILYVIAQNIGAFLASLMVYLSYLNEFKAHPAGMHSIKSSQVFGTLPGNLTTSGIDTFTLFFDQFFATSIFIMIILAVSDENNTTAKLPHTIKALYIGFALMLVGTSFGINCGFAVNPARDFGPRMFTLIFGWGAKVFETGSYFFWIPIVAPMFGAIFAVVIYYVFIGCHLKEN